MERKLTAILSADVKGYSRLMGEDEEATIRTLTAYREVMTTLIQQHRGRVVDSPGDNLLAEFASAVDAVQCAVEVQQELRVKNAELPAQRQMEFRIGINVGDVVTEGERLYGDGVNIAARLEGLAEPGGICISGTVFDHVKNKLALEYEDLGEQEVKNIAEPVRVWRIRLEEAESPKSKVQNPRSKIEKQENRRVGTAHRAGLLMGLMLIVGGLVIAGYFFFPTLLTPHSSLLTQEAQPPSLPLPDKPSIAVLPFVNISEDPKQEYFSDGITEELITGLSRLSGLFVIARTSVFTYKGRAVKVQEVGQELGVRYVLEGSVRKANDQVRITAQLVDATAGHHLWAERYDRPFKDIFALQDDVVQKIVTTLNLQLTLEEQGVLVRKRTDNLEAYDSFLRGLSFYIHLTTKERYEHSPQVKATLVQARQMFEKAIEMDPRYAEAYAALGMTYVQEVYWRWNSGSPPRALGRAFELAQKAAALDDSLAEAHQVLGWVYIWRGPQALEQAIAEGERAVALAPNNPDCYVDLAHLLLYEYWQRGGPITRVDEALKLLEKAMRLNPRWYEPWYLSALGDAYLLKGQYEEAIVTSKKVLSQDAWHLDARLQLALAYLCLDREEEARVEAAEILRLYPNFNMEGLKHTYQDPTELVQALKAQRDAWLERR